MLATMGFVPVGRARADDKSGQNPGIGGNWAAVLRVTPQIELRITLDLKVGKNGSVSGNWASPDEALKDLPFDSLAFKNGVLTFHANFSDAGYKGTLNKAGTEIAGSWTQRGKDYPMTFKRFDPAQVVAAPIPKELEGIWEGKLVVTGGIELRLVLKVEKGKDGALKAVLVSPDQSPIGIPVSQVGLKDGALSFESKRIGAKYAGKRNKTGTAFEGTFTQMGAKLPLVLKKTDKMSEYRRPQTPKPPFPYRAESVSYENKAGGVKLAGTLTIPTGEGPFPAVILLTGSGAQDRDESLLGHKPFLVLADHLSRRGIAVLRVDDRGVGGSTGSIVNSTSEDFAGDALAGVSFLKGRKEIDPGKIGLCGHSEGGIIAPDRGCALGRHRLHRHDGRDRFARNRHPARASAAHPQGQRGFGVGAEIERAPPDFALSHHGREDGREDRAVEGCRSLEGIRGCIARVGAESPGRVRQRALRDDDRPGQ